MGHRGFVAEVLTAGPLEDGVEHVGWAADDVGEGPYLILMRGAGETEVCIITGDADSYSTHYGGVVNVRVDAGESVLELAKEAAEALGVESPVVIRHDRGDVDSAYVQAKVDALVLRGD